MINHLERRFLSFFLAVLMVVVMLPVDVFAIEETVLENKVKVYSASGMDTTLTGGKENNGTITVTAKAKAQCSGGSYKYSATSHTIYVENNTTNETLSLMLDYSASGLGTLTIDGVVKTATPEGDVKKTLAPGEKVTFVLTSPSTGDGNTGNTASLVLSNFSLADPNARKVTVKAGTNGTVSVDGATISADKEVSTTYTTGVAVNAAPASGYDFVAWRDADGNVLSTIATDTIYPLTDMTVSALFVQKNSTAHWLAGGKVHTDLNAACTAAQAGNKLVVLLNSATLPKNDTGYTVPEDVTVLIPYDNDWSVSGDDPVTEEIPNGISNPTATLFRKLTMQSGASLTVNGALEVGAKHYASHGGKQIGGTPVTGYGQIAMEGNSEITVNGKLYAWGYITGADTASVEVNPGGQVYEKFQVTDYHGGSLTGVMLLGDNIFAFNQYYVQNVEVKETIHSGASLICHAGIYGDGVNEMAVNFMSDDGMFKLNSGHVIKRYDASTDRLILDVNGDVSLNPITLDFDGSPYNTANFELPLNDNITININDGAGVTINQDVMLMPGTEINVDNGGTLNLASGKKAYLVNKANWDKFCFGAELRPLKFVGSKAGAPVARSLSVAKLNINGTLEMNGALYNSEAGAVVASSEKTGVIRFNAATPTGSTSINQSLGVGGQSLTDKFNIKATPITMTPVLLTNGTGVEPATVDTTGKPEGTVYDYCATCDMWVTTTATVSFVANNETTETMDAVKVHDGCTGKLPTNTFTAPEGMKFKGWNTVAEPTEETPGVAYDDEAPFTTIAEDGTVTNTFTADTTLYAQWEADGLKGDVDLDGVVAASDLTCLARHLGRLEYITRETALLNADTTGDGEISAADLTKLARYVGRLITSWDQE